MGLDTAEALGITEPLTAESPTKDSAKINAAFIRTALRNYYTGNAWALVFEVARGTGGHANRHLDAIAMSLFPSRGLDFIGFEIKISRSDLLRELKSPEKAEEIAAFTDFFNIVAPIGLVVPAELPPAWGLIEVTAAGKLIFKKAAKKTESATIDRKFMAALLRASTRSYNPDDLKTAIKLERDKIYETFEKDCETRINNARYHDKGDAENWRELVNVLAGRGRSWLFKENVIAAIKFVMGCDILGAQSHIRGIQNTLEVAAEKLKREMDALGVMASVEKE